MLSPIPLVDPVTSASLGLVAMIVGAFSGRDCWRIMALAERIAGHQQRKEPTVGELCELDIELGELSTSCEAGDEREQVHAEVRRLRDLGILMSATSVGRSCFKVSFKPPARGRHELTVKLRGKDISSSPIPIFVKYPLRDLGVPVKDIRLVGEVGGVRFGPEGAMYLCEGHTGKISVCDRDGEVIRSFPTKAIDRKEMICPVGVCIDPAGGVFVSDNAAHKVFKFDAEGMIVRSVGGKGEREAEFQCPYGMLLQRGELFVCDILNHRVQVFDKNLKFLRQFGGLGHRGGRFNEPNEPALHSDGNLLLTDFENDRIPIMSPYGQFVSILGKYDNSPGDLQGPVGIMSHDNHVFVTEWRSHRVSVFTSGGEFVTKFGQKGEGPGEFHQPCSVAVDMDGFVHVAEFRKGRIQVF